MRYALGLLALWAAGTATAAPPEGLEFALWDASHLDKTTAYFTRYLDVTHLSAALRTTYTEADTLQINLLSRRPTFGRFRILRSATDPNNTLPQALALDLRDYSIDPKVWDRLANRDPYFHQTLNEVVNEPQYTTDAYGRQVANGSKTRTVRKHIPARHLDQAKLNQLYALTSSQAPILLADWFLAQTAISSDRDAEKDGKFVGGGFSYYDFLGIKNRDDYFKLIGLDQANRRTLDSKLSEVVTSDDTGVAQNDRLVVRLAAPDGFAWFTLDTFDNNRDEKNVLEFLDPENGLVHNAERHFGRLPNGLACVIACTDKGELQVSAPDKIGPDSTANGHDARIHVPKSCIACHSDDWMKNIKGSVRDIFTFDPKRGGRLLASPDYEKKKKLEAVFLRDLNPWLKHDRALYASSTAELVPGKKISELMATYVRAYERYDLGTVDQQEAADVVGVSLETLKTKMDQYEIPTSGETNLVAITLAKLNAGRPITRTQFEQLYPLLCEICRGKPVEVKKP